MVGGCRNLSDINNRGKLNLPEFHVAMGLIYRGEYGRTRRNTDSRDIGLTLEIRF